MIYLLYNGAQQTTATPVVVTTGTAIKTMQQVKVLQPARLIEWGISFSAFTPAAPIVVELIETDVAATVTAYVAADITGVDAEAVSFGDPTSQMISVGTSASGFTASAEGTITAVRNIDGPGQDTNTISPFVKQFPLGREPYLRAGKYYRIRVTATAAVNALCYMVLSF